MTDDIGNQAPACHVTLEPCFRLGLTPPALISSLDDLVIPMRTTAADCNGRCLFNGRQYCAAQGDLRFG